LENSHYVTKGMAKEISPVFGFEKKGLLFPQSLRKWDKNTIMTRMKTELKIYPLCLQSHDLFWCKGSHAREKRSFIKVTYEAVLK